MQDGGLLAPYVLVGVVAIGLVFRMLLLGEMRRWTSEQKARLIDVFYRQNKITTAILIAAVLLILAPAALGVRSVLITLAAAFLACGVVVGGGLWAHLKLRRLRFPRRFIVLHACHAIVLALGLTVYWVLFRAG